MSDDYDVGFGKPPKKSQFKKGQSGNPNGRPKRCKNVLTDIHEELDEMVNVTEGCNTVRMTKQRALVKATIAKASQGHTPSVKLLLELKAQAELKREERHSEPLLDEEDLAILENFKHTQGGNDEPTT
tara:strand:+ start:628 stop:1011 length:384 start_codon:yes stop_codon:yes gene_type:complete